MHDIAEFWHLFGIDGKEWPAYPRHTEKVSMLQAKTHVSKVVIFLYIID